MEFNEIKTGEIFTIGDTPTYPKLKTDYGYIDMRDQFKITTKSLPFDIRPMTNRELVQKAPYEITEAEIGTWKNDLLVL